MKQIYISIVALLAVLFVPTMALAQGEKDLDLSAINPALIGEGTYDATTHALKTSQYGIGGWQFNDGQDWRDYDKLVVELQEPQTTGAQIRIYDDGNIWGTNYMVEPGSETSVVINLKNMTHNNDGDKDGSALDLSHIYYVAFWSYGESEIKIKRVYLVESSEKSDPDVTDGSIFSLSTLNAHIWDPDNVASYNAETGELKTAMYGFGGWEFAEPKDFSGYKSLVVELNQPQTTGASLRLFDTESYWEPCSETDLGDATTFSLDLTTLKKANGDDIDLSSIYKVGFWSYGESVISIKSVYLVADPTGITNVKTEVANTEKIAYNLSGQRVNANSKGIVIIDGKKYINR